MADTPTPTAPPPDAEIPSAPLELFGKKGVKPPAAAPKGLSTAEADFFGSGGTKVPDTTPDTKPPEAPPPESKPPESKPPEAPTVPTAALLAERRRWQEQLQAETQRRQQLEEAIRQATQQTPDPTEDPVGYLQAQNDQLRQQLAQVAEIQARQTQEQSQIGLRRQVMERIQAAASAYRTKAPDYADAWNHLVSERQKQLAPLITDPIQREQAMLEEALQIGAQALQEGQDPADRFYNLAKAWGYAPKASKPDADAVKKIQDGLANASPGGGGAPPSGELTPQDLLNERDPEKLRQKWAQYFPS